MRVSFFNKPGPPPAGRPKTGYSVRGKKISNPILIPHPTEDEEFPMRTPGTGIATPVDGSAKEPHEAFRPPSRPSPPPLPPASGSNSQLVSRSRTDVAAPHDTSSTDFAARRPSESTPMSAQMPQTPQTPPQSMPPRRRMNPPPSAVRYSIVSAASTGQTGNSREMPQRKKSTLRGALGKLFGRKKKSSSQTSTDTDRMADVGSSSQHRSDPTALSRLVNPDASPKRSNSLPITEFDRALRSHSIGPGDITAIESARNSLQTDFSPSRRRGGFGTTRLYSSMRPREAGEWAGLSPRPASTHGRGSHLFTREEDPDEIGRALTSDSGGMANLRRRSRSLSGLQEIVTGHTGVRRRSEEIRYWRESYEAGVLSPLSPLSSNPPDDDNDDTGVVSIEGPEPAESAQPKTPPQPFNFGSLTSTNAMAGMRITQAASLDTRVGNLEERMMRLERVVDSLCQSVPDFKMPVFEPENQRQTAVPRPGQSTRPPYAASTATTTAPALSSIYQTASDDTNASSSRYTASRHSNDSFGEAPTYIGSLHPATLPQPASTANAHRPTSTSTVRGATSLPSLPRELSSPFTADHYTTLLALIETERSARQMLEVQVRRLNQRVNMASMQAPLKTSGLAVEGLGSRVSVFEQDEDDDEEGEGEDEDEDEAEDEEEGEGSRVAGTEDSYSEAFQTPSEDQPLGFGAFGEELRDDDDGKPKKAARTLSLSQLTLKQQKQQKQQQQQSPTMSMGINF